MRALLGLRSRALGSGLLGRAAAAPAKAAKGGAGKKGGKGDAKAGGPTGTTVPAEVRESTVLGANVLKDGTDPKTRPDSEYPDWLWTLLDARPTLGELKRKRIEDMSMEELQRLVKLENRGKIEENNRLKAKS